MIKIHNLIKKLPCGFILKADQLLFEDGHIYGLIGNNGSGKTLLLNLILNIVQPDRGSIEIGGCVNKKEKWKNNTGVYLSRNYLLEFMTPIEYWYFVGSFFKMNKKHIDKVISNYVQFFGGDFEQIINKQICKLSRGVKDKVGIVSSLINSPSLLILDEPFLHLDQTSLKFIEDTLLLLNKKSLNTQIITSPKEDNTISLCSRLVFIKNGEIYF